MDDDTSASGRSEATTIPNRKPYQRPELQVYGKLHLLTQGTGGTVGDAGTGLMVMSDRSTKENIVRVGTHPLGIGVYLFDYKSAYRAHHGAGRRLGVMADEVEAVLPEAVSMHADGYRMVDYGMLRQRAAIR